MLDKTRGSIDDQFRLEITISGSYQCDPSFPKVDGLSVLSTHSSSRMHFGFGKGSSQEKIFTYIFSAERTGTFEIPSFSCEIDRERQQTAPLKLVVAESSAKDQSAAQKPAVLEREFSKTEVFLGEQILIKSRLIAMLPMVSNPSFEAAYPNFLKYSKGHRAYQDQYKGQAATIIEIPEVIVASKAGEYELAPAHAELGVQMPGRSGGGSVFELFDHPMFGQSLRRVKLRTSAQKIVVKPLPKEGRSAQFSGLVGEFRITAQLAKSQAEVGESVSVEVLLEGEGSTAGVDKLVWNPGPHWKVYNDKAVDQFEIDPDRGFVGTKTYRYAIVPKDPGTHSVAPFEVQVFDPKASAYKTLRVEFSAVEVRGDSTQSKVLAPQPSTSALPTPEEAKSEDEAVRESLWDRVQDLRNNVVFWVILTALIGGAVIAWVGRLVWTRRQRFLQEKAPSLRKRRALDVFKEQSSVADAAKLLQAWLEFCADLRMIPASGLIGSDVTDLALSVSFSRVADLRSVIAELEAIVYAERSTSQDHLDDLRRRSLELASELFTAVP